MVGALDLAVTLGGIIIPPAFDFFKKKFIKEENDTPERTIGSLATTKPEVISGYVEALAKWLDSKVKYFNRDVIGQPCSLIVNIRAGIRPFGVIFAMFILGWMVYLALAGELQNVAAQIGQDTLTGIRLSCEGMVSSWFGNRITLSK